MREQRSPESGQPGSQTEVATHVELPTKAVTPQPPSAPATRSKLSVNVNHQISERLRSLAYNYRLSESSIVEIALTIFFARGDDALLGLLLKQLGATRRSK